MLRSSYTILDVTFCALQGYLGSVLFNGIKTYKSNSSVNAALAFGAIALTERIIYQASLKLIPGPTISLFGIPAGTKNIVSYGLATYLTLKIMQIAGRILNIPQEVAYLGYACAAALTLGGLRKAWVESSKSVEQRLQEHLLSKTFANKIFPITFEGKTYQVRVICNPEGKKMIFPIKNWGSLFSSNLFIVASNENLPQGITEKLPVLLNDSCLSFSVAMNNILPLEYTASPMVR